MDEMEPIDATLAFLEEALAECEGNWGVIGDEEVSFEALTIPQVPRIKAKTRKRRGLNHNKGRKELQTELVRLRVEAENLEFTLQRLQEIKGKRNWSNDKQCPSNKSNGVWMEACGRQLEQRLRAERENLQLKKNCDREERIAKRLENMIYKRPRWDMAYPETQSGFLTRRIEIPEGYMNQTAALIFDKLSTSVNDCYNAITEVDRIGEMEATATRRPLLRDNMDGGTHVEVFDCTILPFSMTETGEAWWEVWHEFRGQCGHDKTDDVVAESFGLEIRDVETDTSATFYVQQILHRYVKEDHILYVWNMYTEPFLFKNNRVHGVYYREQSYALVKPVKMHGEVTPCSQMLSSEDIKVEFLDPTTKKDTRITALTKHVAKSMPPYITMRNEAIETFLLDRTLQCRT